MGLNKLLITVIIPVYNVREYVEKCVMSVISQTYENIEIICVDDGSTDGSAEVLDKFAKSDSRVHVIHKENGGLVSARKIGTRQATGDYIIHVDGDDYIASTRIENLVKSICQEATDIIFLHGKNIVYSDKVVYVGEEIEYKLYSTDKLEEITSLMLDDNMNLKLHFAMWSTAVRLDILKKCQEMVDDNISNLEDYACIIMCLTMAKTIKIIPECGYYYTNRTGSITRNYNNSNYKKYLIAWRFIKNYAEKTNCWKALESFMIKYTLSSLLYSGYDAFLTSKYDFLYPFKEIKRGANIVIYGSGLVGAGIVNYLQYNSHYNLVAWIDENINNQPFQDICVQPIDSILHNQYDYVAIAVKNKKVSNKIWDKLISIGVQEQKIQMINYDMFVKGYLPKEFLN